MGWEGVCCSNVFSINFIFYQEDFADRRSLNITDDDVKELLNMFGEKSYFESKVFKAKASNNLSDFQSASKGLKEVNDNITGWKTTHFLFDREINVE